MSEGGGTQAFRVNVNTKAGVTALDTLTQAAIVARGAIKALNAAGGQGAMLAAAAAARANAEAQKASAMAAKAVAEQARAAAPMLKAQAAADLAAARASKVATDEKNAAAKTAAQLTTEGIKQQKMAADASRAQIAADRAAEDALNRKAAATKSASASLMEGVGTVKGYASQVLDLAQKAGDAAKQLYDFAAEGQKLKGLDTAFKTLGGNAEEMEKLRKATGGVVDDATLQRVYNLGSLFELPKQHIPDLIRLAKGASVALGTTVAKSLEDTFTAASRQSKMISDNMGIVIGDLAPKYAEFAKKAGKSVDDLTDKEKQLVFIQTMIAKGGRQVDLAAAASANSFASAEAQVTNFTNSLKVGLAETFVSSGAFDAMGRALEMVKGMFAENGDKIASVVMPAFNAVVQILPHVGGLFATLLPVLQPLTTALGTVSSVLQLVTPLLGVALGAFSGLANIILQLVNVALMALLQALREVASVFSDDMANAIQKSIDTLDRSLPATEAQTEALKKEGEVAEKTAAKWGFLDEMRRRALVDNVAKTDKRGGFTGEEFAAQLGIGPEQLAKINADMETFDKQYTAHLAYLASNLKQSEIAALTIQQQREIIAASTKTEAELKILADKSLGQAALLMEERLGLETAKHDGIKKILQKNMDDELAAESAGRAKTMGEASKSLSDMEKMYQDSVSFRVSEITKGAKNEKEERQKLEAYYKTHMKNVRKVYGEGAEAMYHDAMTYQNSTLATLMMSGAKNEQEALAKLETYYEDHLAKIQLLYADNAEVMAKQEAVLATVVNDAAQKLEEDASKKKKTGRGPDYEAAIAEARAALMEEGERNIYDIKKKYEEMAEKLPKKEKDLRVALEKQAMAEVIDLQAERRKREVEAIVSAGEVARNEAAALSDFLASEGQKRYQQALRSIQDEAQARRAAANGDQGSLAAISAKERLEVARVQAATLKETFEGAFSDKFSRYRESQTKDLDKSRKSAQQWASTFQSAGNTVVDAMFNVAGGSMDMREAVFKTMGSLFGQLSTAYLAWANTEIAMFSGNPWLGAVAAVALGAVASAISSFGTRGKGGSGASSGSASREVRNRESDERRGGPNITINAMGFTTADDVARAVAKGELRGNELTGRSADRRAA